MSDPSPATILIVEDNDFVRMQLVRYLEEGGYKVREASDGTGALAILKLEPIGAMVLDVRMEPMDGFELLKIMQGQNIKCPIILVTGDNNPDLLSDASRGQVSAILLKPIQKDRILNMVSRALLQTKQS